MSVLYPNVPNFPGVPPVLRQVGAEIEGFVSLLLADTIEGSNAVEIEWGIFDYNGYPMVIPDSVISFEYLREARIADYPIEEGGFESYNKVFRPYDCRIEMAKGGSLADRQDFLDKIEDLVESLDLYAVVMPEKAFIGANVVRYDIGRRTQESGAQMLVVAVQIQEVRENAVSIFTNSKTVSGSQTVNDGSVQTTTPTPEQTPASPPQ